MVFVVKKFSKKMIEYDAVIKLYKQSFPKNERIPIWLLLLGAKRKRVNFFIFSIERKNKSCELIGFIYLVHYKNLTYIAFFAIHPSMRQRGFGSDILKWVKEKFPEQTIILAIEEVKEYYTNYSERLTRQNFYKKNGFELAGFTMIECKVRYSLMIDGKASNRKNYCKVINKYTMGYRLIHIKDEK